MTIVVRIETAPDDNGTIIFTCQDAGEPNGFYFHENLCIVVNTQSLIGRQESGLPTVSILLAHIVNEFPAIPQ